MSSIEEKKNVYRRVRGLRWGVNRSLLRQADDHLLVCDYRTGFVERYKRFYFRDIEAFIIRKTPFWIVAISLWGFFGICFLIISFANNWNPFLLIVTGICSVGIMLELIRGPSCRTDIKTAVQTDRLRMLKRIRKTQRVLRTIFPLVEAVQGKREEITGVTATSAPGRVTPAPGESLPVAGAAAPPADETIAPPPRLSWLHVVMFILVVFTGAVALWEANFNSTAFLTFVILFALVAISGIIAVVRQARRRVHGVAAGMVWVVVISYVVGGVWVNTGYSFIEQLDTNSTPFREISPFQMRQMVGFDYVLWAYGILSLVVGLIGLIFTLMPAPAAAQPPPLPPKQA